MIPPGTNHVGSTIRRGHTQGRTPSSSIPKQEIEGLEHSTTPIERTILTMNVGENIPVTEFNQEEENIQEGEPLNQSNVNNHLSRE